MENKIYDLIIIGSGPAGLSASVYASRYKLNHLVVGTAPGGYLKEIHNLENFPGFISISGQDFIQKMTEQVENFGAVIKNESVMAIEKLEKENVWRVEAANGKTNEYKTKSIILAMGTERKRMNIPGEKEFLGKGVSYCATCDGMFFRDKVVSVIGGGNAAAAVAVEMSTFASKIYLVHRGENMMAEPFWMDKINANPKIELVKNTNVIEIRGTGRVERIILEEPFNDHTFLKTDGVFIEIGSEPNVPIVQKIGVEMDKDRYIKTAPDQSTNLPGIYAAGDITTNSNKFRQVLTACAEGAIAADSAYRWLKLS